MNTTPTTTELTTRLQRLMAAQGFEARKRAHRIAKIIATRTGRTQAQVLEANA